jgi:hypothetical protein
MCERPEAFRRRWRSFRRGPACAVESEAIKLKIEMMCATGALKGQGGAFSLSRPTNKCRPPFIFGLPVKLFLTAHLVVHSAGTFASKRACGASPDSANSEAFGTCGPACLWRSSAGCTRRRLPFSKIQTAPLFEARQYANRTRPTSSACWVLRFSAPT